MSPSRAIVFDNEAIQALTDVTHAKHRRALGIVEAAAARNRKNAGTVRMVVPVAARVEAGWDRRNPRAAAINRLRIADHPLDTAIANVAAELVRVLAVSVADAHIGALLPTLPSPCSVVTSDVDDVRRLASHLDVRPTIVRL